MFHIKFCIPFSLFTGNGAVNPSYSVDISNKFRHIFLGAINHGWPPVFLFIDAHFLFSRLHSRKCQINLAGGGLESKFLILLKVL